jgi:hypothetical protein
MVQLAEHGTPERYRQGCTEGADGGRCRPCKDAWAAHTRAKRAADREARDAAGGALWAAEAQADAGHFEPGDSGHDCPAGHPRQWAGAHTVLVCLECKQMGSSPGAQAREADLGQALAERKARASAVARRGPADIDVLALERRKGVMLEQLADYAGRARLRPGDARVIKQIERWVEDAESDARLDELIDLLGGEVKRPRWWQASAAEQVIGALGDDEDEYGEGEYGENEYGEAEAPLATPASIAAQQWRANKGGESHGSPFWDEYDRNTAAAARAAALRSAQVRQLRPQVNAAAARRQGFSACGCGGWADPAQRYVTYAGAWCRNCGALIRSPHTPSVPVLDLARRPVDPYADWEAGAGR